MTVLQDMMKLTDFAVHAQNNGRQFLANARALAQDPHVIKLLDDAESLLANVEADMLTLGHRLEEMHTLQIDNLKETVF